MRPLESDFIKTIINKKRGDKRINAIKDKIKSNSRFVILYILPPFFKTNSVSLYLVHISLVL